MDAISNKTKPNKDKAKKLVLTRPKIRPMEDVNLYGVPKPEEVCISFVRCLIKTLHYFWGQTGHGVFCHAYGCFSGQ